MFARDGDGRLRRRSARSRNIHGPPHAAKRPAFSLAELMIALAVLGMGLLVIAAALPAGVKYTKQTVDQSTASAAADYAFELIEQNVALRDTILDPSTGAYQRAPVLFQPRYPTDLDPNDVLLADGTPGTDTLSDYGRPAWSPDNKRYYEPMVKVRPLFLANIQAQPGASRGHALLVDNAVTEDAIYSWLDGWMSGLGITVDKKECDAGTIAGGVTWLRPAMSPTSLTYPPPPAGGSYVQLPDAYLLSESGRPYATEQVTGPGGSYGDETMQALERRAVWTAFYRRVSYAEGADPALYEFIVVVCRRPTENHWFPVQDAQHGGTPLNNSGEDALDYDQVDYGALAPIPWLVTFDPLVNALPVPPPLWYHRTSGGERTLEPGYEAPPSLTFVASAAVGALLPQGSVFIPALNDDRPSALNSVTGTPPIQTGGFVPSAPNALAIYTVTERVLRPDGRYDIVVGHNGLSPWVNETANPMSSLWPVWVIPPAAEGPIDGATLSDQSPVLSVERRFVRLRELP